jgi:hypothetical protein
MKILKFFEHLIHPPTIQSHPKSSQNIHFINYQEREWRVAALKNWYYGLLQGCVVEWGGERMAPS